MPGRPKNNERIREPSERTCCEPSQTQDEPTETLPQKLLWYVMLVISRYLSFLLV